MRRPGIEPGSTAWKAAMLTTIPPTLLKVQDISSGYNKNYGRDWYGASIVLSSGQKTPWRNGSASDSRSEGCVFESRRGQLFYVKNKKAVFKKYSVTAETRIRTWVTAATTQGPNH